MTFFSCPALCADPSWGDEERPPGKFVDSNLPTIPPSDTQWPSSTTTRDAGSTNVASRDGGTVKPVIWPDAAVALPLDAAVMDADIIGSVLDAFSGFLGSGGTVDAQSPEASTADAAVGQ